jgi:hypothetical protein
MIERFNFYDVYAYLVPGLLLLAGIWLPFGLTGDPFPSAEWGSALGFVLVGYVMGILVHEISRETPFFRRDPQPSTTMIVAKNALLAEPARTQLVGRIAAEFEGLDAVAAPTVAFKACRDRVLGAKGGQYFEQMQGMFGLMRGLSSAASLCAAWYLGWLAYAWLGASTWTYFPLVISIVAALVWWLIRDNKRKPVLGWLCCSVPLLTASVGAFAANGSLENPAHAQRIGGVLVAALFAAVIFGRSYVRYTDLYAEAVYTAFLSLPKPRKGRSDKDDSRD